MTGWQVAEAPAKVNLRLEVLGPRPDGYHELDTWMLALDLCDRVRARRRAAPGIGLRVSGPHAGADIRADEGNLVWRAAAGVLAALGEPAGIELELEKHVPSGAGLGGGSSDAAATVLAVEAALGRELGADRRRALLASLGSDCVFFHDAAASGFARCRGRGEQVTPLPAPPAGWWVSLVTPDLRCPTASVYAALADPLCPAPEVPRLPMSDLAQPIDEVRRRMQNQLEAAALHAVPGLRTWKEMFARCGAQQMRLAGSGSTFFALHDELGEARAELERIESEIERSTLGARLLAVVPPAGRGARLMD